MAGLPRQRVEEVEESIAFVKKAGAKPILVEYSPIPGTPLFEETKHKIKNLDTLFKIADSNIIVSVKYRLNPEDINNIMMTKIQDFLELKDKLNEADKRRVIEFVKKDIDTFTKQSLPIEDADIIDFRVENIDDNFLSTLYDNIYQSAENMDNINA
jgi:radical SAM superfamily enzyme YgiQ (UPF0313 family)